MKVNMTINDELMAKIDKYADENYMSRSQFFTSVSKQYLNQIELLSALNEVSKAIKKISENNFIDDDSKKTLDAFEFLLKNVR